MYDEDDLLQLSALEHLAFCERQCALIHLEQVWIENVATIEGQRLHDRAHEVGTESRGDVRVARGLLLRSLRLGLSGKTDVVEFRLLGQGEPETSGTTLPGVSGRWRPYPVEYKRGRKRHEFSYEVQLCAQALCLEEMLGVTVPEGALYYGKSARRQEVCFSGQLRRATESAAIRLHEMFQARMTPKAEYNRNKCRQCSLVGVCLPERTGKSFSVEAYLVRASSDSGPTLSSDTRGNGEGGL